MKKTIALTAAILLLLAIAPNVFANPQSMIVAYVNVPNGWNNPCIWAWDDAGNNAFAAWPGGETEADPNNAGWYYCYLPNWATNVIVNANEGTVQTDALSTGGRNFWVTVRAADNAAISFTAQTTGQAPAYVERITVNAKVPVSWENPCLWAWSHPDGTNAFASWPGGSMRGAAGEWYSVRAPSWINSVIINGNNGSVQTSDMKIEQGKEIWIVVDSNNAAEVYYENPDFIVANITIRTKVPASWENPCLWAWSHPDGTNAFAAWPGQPFARNGDWYETTLPGWVNSIIVNANSGGIQTGDMRVEQGSDIWIVVTDAENYTYYYAAPEGTTRSSAGATLWIILATIGAAIIAGISVLVIKKKKK